MNPTPLLPYFDTQHSIFEEKLTSHGFYGYLKSDLRGSKTKFLN